MLLSRSLKLAVLGFAVFLAGGCDRQSGADAQPQASQGPAGKQAAGVIDRSHKGSELPDFTLRDPEGNSLRLPSLKGQPVLVNLWATWCAPCVIELPMLNSLANRAGNPVRIVTISQDSSAPEKVRAFLDQRGLAQLPAWLDPENDLSFHYGTGTLPTTILYDAQGREVWRFIGGHDWTTQESAKMLAEAQ